MPAAPVLSSGVDRQVGTVSLFATVLLNPFSTRSAGQQSQAVKRLSSSQQPQTLGSRHMHQVLSKRHQQPGTGQVQCEDGARWPSCLWRGLWSAP